MKARSLFNSLIVIGLLNGTAVLAQENQEKQEKKEISKPKKVASQCLPGYSGATKLMKTTLNVPSVSGWWKANAQGFDYDIKVVSAQGAFAVKARPRGSAPTQRYSPAELAQLEAAYPTFQGQVCNNPSDPDAVTIHVNTPMGNQKIALKKKDSNIWVNWDGKTAMLVRTR